MNVQYKDFTQVPIDNQHKIDETPKIKRYGFLLYPKIGNESLIIP